MGRVVNWAQVCVFLNFHAISWTGENADSNLQSKVWQLSFKEYSILYPFVVPTRFLQNKWSYATNKRSGATNWRCATNKNEFNALESIHSRAAKVIYNLPRDLPSVDVQKSVKWDLLFDMCKAKIATLIYKIFHRITPSFLEHLIQRRENKYNFRHHHRVTVRNAPHEELHLVQRIPCLELVRSLPWLTQEPTLKWS